MHPARRRPLPFILVPLLAFGAACVTLWEPPAPQRFHRTAEIPDAEELGADECVVCHEDVKDRAPISTWHGDCEACHGLGSIHEETEEPEDIRYPSVADCLGCHETGHSALLAWRTGEHERAGLICTDCHNPHLREPHELRPFPHVAFRTLDASSSLCIGCHPTVASRLNFPSHHPVREGMLSCTDCHGPHDDRRTTVGMGTQRCASCHQDVVGPWIWEHTPVAEDCSYCHDPHGSPSYNLLDTSQPALCLACHTSPDDAHFLQSGEPGLTTISGDRPTGSSALTGAVAGAFYTRCTDCHAAIHGSYQDPHLRR